MAKKSGSAGPRVKKKNTKEVQRRKAQAARPGGAAPRVVVGRSGWVPAEEGIEGLVARIEIHYHQAACNAADHAGVTPAQLPGVLSTPERIAALETTALLERLAGLGVATDRDDFLAGTTTGGSALRFAEEAWLPRLTASATVHDRDFVRLAACELWKRFHPKSPSIEGLLDLMSRGLDHARKQEDPRAVEIWLDFWGQLEPRLPPEARTLKKVDAFFGEHFSSIDTWLELLLSAAESSWKRHPDLVRRTVSVVQEIRERLSEEDEQYRNMLLSDEAGLLFRTGSPEAGERVLRDAIAHDPTNADTHITLSDLLAPPESTDREAIARAIAVLEEAVKNRDEAGKEGLLDARLAGMRKRLKK